jgi:hypothetical protein
VNEHALKEWANATGADECDSFEALCRDPKAAAAVLADLNVLAKGPVRCCTAAFLISCYLSAVSKV